MHNKSNTNARRLQRKMLTQHLPLLRIHCTIHRTHVRSILAPMIGNFLTQQLPLLRISRTSPPAHESMLRIRHQRPLTQVRSILVLCRASSLTHACSIMAPFIGNMLTQQVPLLHICRMISLTRICSILAPTTGIQRVHPFPALQLLSQSNFPRIFVMEDRTQEVMLSG